MSEPHIALYRKYRPHSFADVVGQEQLVQLLESAIKHNKVSHAYLFCGGRGTGKTSVARIFAHDIGCNPEDIIEIDAASNRGIDEIRELRDAVRTAPFSSPYKVYIVDEAHMLTKEAANALLKTLEEPPSHVIFILATTDPEKLPQTIVSRCQKIVFQSPDVTTLAKRLMYVAQKEGKSIDDTTVELIARHGKGSYRDALGVLEQIFTTGNTKITYEGALSFLGIADKEVLIALVTALGKKDAVALASTLTTLQNSEHSSLRTYDDVVEMLRVGLLARVAGMAHDEHSQAIMKLAQAYPYTVSSKTILELLSKRELLQVSQISSWAAFQAIMFSLIEEGK